VHYWCVRLPDNCQDVTVASWLRYCWKVVDKFVDRYFPAVTVISFIWWGVCATPGNFVRFVCRLMLNSTCFAVRLVCDQCVSLKTFYCSNCLFVFICLHIRKKMWQSHIFGKLCSFLVCLSNLLCFVAKHRFCFISYVEILILKLTKWLFAGGLIDPSDGTRVTLDQALANGWIDKRMSDRLTDLKRYTKCVVDLRTNLLVSLPGVSLVSAASCRTRLLFVLFVSVQRG